MSANACDAAAEAYIRAFETWDLGAVKSLVADDAIEGGPQSGERFPGRGNILGMVQSLPSKPNITWRSIRGGPPVWVAEGLVEYGEGPVHLIGIAGFEGG